MITEKLLQRNGAPCSKCGQAFSPQNQPLITILPNKTYRGKEVSSAICNSPPFFHKHKQMEEDTALTTVFISTTNGYREIMAKDLDLEAFNDTAAK